MLRVTLDGMDTVEKRQVTTGTPLPGYIEILDGLKIGDEVVTHGNNKVSQGDKLTVLAVDDGSVDISTILKKRNIAGDSP